MMKLKIVTVLLIAVALSLASFQQSLAAKNEKLIRTKDIEVSGSLLGKPFSPDKVTLNDGILKIRQGDDPFADLELTVFLRIEKGSVPSSKRFYVGEPGKPNSDVTIHLSKSQSGGMPKGKIISSGYKLQLSFGEEKNGALPGTISLFVPGKLDTQVRGKFLAQLEGYRIIDGKVDLTADSIDTLLAVAESYLQEKHKGKRVVIEKTEEEALIIKPQNRKIGQAYITYSADGVQKKIKLQLDKKYGKWIVNKELKPTQIFLAHQLHVPVPAPIPVGGKLPRDWGDFFRHLAAKRGESEANRKYPGKPLFNSEVIVKFDIKLGVMETEFSVEAEGGGKFVKTYHFPLDQEKGAWKFNREKISSNKKNTPDLKSVR